MADCTTLTSSMGSFTSPNFPSNYANNLDVCWLINGNKYVRISFDYLVVENDHDFVRVYGGDSINSPLLLEASGQYAGTNAGNYSLTAVSNKNQMIVSLNTDSANAYPGLTAKYSSCTVLTKYIGSISSPNYPNNYNDMDSAC